MKTPTKYGQEVKETLRYESSENKTIVAEITYTKDKAMEYLVKKVDLLQKQVEQLKNKEITTKASIIKFWDNTYDERWNNH